MIKTQDLSQQMSTATKKLVFIRVTWEVNITLRPCFYQILVINFPYSRYSRSLIFHAKANLVVDNAMASVLNKCEDYREFRQLSILMTCKLSGLGTTNIHVERALQNEIQIMDGSAESIVLSIKNQVYVEQERPQKIMSWVYV